MANPDVGRLSLTITHTLTGAHIRMADEPAHDTDTLDCWCLPKFYRVCDECEAEPMAGVEVIGCTPPHPGCWNCEHGLIALSRVQAEHVGMALVVVHR